MMNSNDSSLRYAVTLLNQNAFTFWSFLLGLSWLSWYFIKFTVIPLLRPNEPKELPYFVPCKLSIEFALLVPNLL